MGGREKTILSSSGLVNGFEHKESSVCNSVPHLGVEKKFTVQCFPLVASRSMGGSSLYFAKLTVPHRSYTDIILGASLINGNVKVGKLK